MNAAPFFREDRPERLDALRAEATRWNGTPFFPNSCSPGPKGGVCCHKLAGALYRATGLIAADLPDAPMAHARFNAASLVEEWLEDRREFLRFAVADVPTVQPGDLIGFRLMRTVHHLGVCVWPGVFVHAIEHLGTSQSSLGDPTWGKRLTTIWRPIEPNQEP